ncbi:nitroreductase family protein [Ekhidna sp. To15]|uniref:nitroreductase family protein n=1 Tax=Ekhidna sp. To15 TaxID=3395267 RepID=UPI003F51B0CC
MSLINETIRKRRSVYPMQYIDKPIPREILKELLLNANHAPTHKLTEPWRFKIFLEEGKTQLGDFLAEKYREITPEFVPSKFEKIKSNAQKAGAMLAIILHRDPAERVPEWEETASVACAVQNIWLALDQYELGGYWSSPPLCKFLGEHIKLKENESCIGFFYIGYCESSDRIIAKKPIEEKIEWIDK